MFVAASIVGWKQGKDYGLETLVTDKRIQGQLVHHHTTRPSGPAEGFALSLLRFGYPLDQVSRVFREVTEFVRRRALQHGTQHMLCIGHQIV